MKIIADTHCHTLASTHAYSTIIENISVAKRKNLYAIAITDHAATMPGAPGKWFFMNLKSIPRTVNGVLILRGVEANIINSQGEIDLDLEKEHSNLDWVVASAHSPTFSEEITDSLDMTQAYLNLSENPVINVIGHSGTPHFPYDIEKVIPYFGKNGKLVEINNHSFKARPDSISNCINIAKACKKHRVPVIINSDAHFCETVGESSKAVDMLKSIDFPEELVVNSSIERFNEYLKRYTKILN